MVGWHSFGYLLNEWLFFHLTNVLIDCTARKFNSYFPIDRKVIIQEIIEISIIVRGGPSFISQIWVEKITVNMIFGQNFISDSWSGVRDVLGELGELWPLHVGSKDFRLTGRQAYAFIIVWISGDIILVILIDSIALSNHCPYLSELALLSDMSRRFLSYGFTLFLKECIHTI